MDHRLDRGRIRIERVRLGTRFFWVVFGVSASVFASSMAFGVYYNSHHDTKGAPLRNVIWPLFGLASDVIIWAVALTAALTYAALTEQRTAS
jgi:hypothetical protein